MAAGVHHHGCENPIADVQVCWDAQGDAGEEYAPFSDVHLLPIAQNRQGETQLLPEYTRSIFRQLLPSGLADNLTQEWQPATSLEEAIAVARLHQWGLTLWISPRQFRESSPNASGIVDLDVYLLKHGKPLRTLRVRAESQPTRPGKGVETGTTVGALMLATGAAFSNPVASASTVVGSVAMAPHHPPESGRPLELLSEYAIRQMLTTFKYPMEQLRSTPEASQNKRLATEWVDQFFAPK
ncbi:hypothetical protein [Candidatus Magnetaquicoccus inordinatus]|uniref:hypothetical protein n=1 Tax=Candidatus Magnetaquicoccus inordinatus TaxID=2496818 RepID=UPI00102B9BF2|nr:hypothetical protein [Candidatus Magnetaquicoccus inordinatus]